MRLIDADALLEKFNRKVADMWTALTDEDTADDFAFYCKLADAVEEMPTTDRWISVKDRLPGKNGDYLAYTCDKIVWPYYFTASSGVWEDALGYSTDTVTHWMPLPEPPKEDKNDE